MSGFLVTSSELRRKANELRGINRQFKNSVNKLGSTEESLNSMWDGQANEIFHTAFMSDKGQMTEFANMIDKYCDALDRIAAKYEENERKNIDLARNRIY